MAKKDDFEDIEDFEDFDFDDLDDDFEDDASKTAKSTKGKSKKSSRKAIEETIKDAYEAAKDNIKSKKVKDHAKRVLEASLSNDAKSSLNDLRYELSKMQEEANKQLAPLKNSLAGISKTLSDTLPKGKISNLFETLSKKLKSESSLAYAEQKETLADFKNAFESSLGDVDNKIAALTGQLTSKNARLQNEIAKRQYTTLMAMREQDRIFYNKSLELQWRMTTGIEESLKFQRSQFETFTKQFEAIVKNTSLPEAVKLHNSEVAGMVMKQKAFSSLSESIFKKVNPLEGFTFAINRKLRETLMDARDSSSNMQDLLGMAGDFRDMQEMGMSKGTLAGGLGSDLLLGLLYEKLGRAIPKNIRNKLSGNIIGLASNPMDYLKSMKTKDPKGLFGKLLNRGVEGLEGMVPTNNAFNNIKLNKAELDSQALFDGRTYSSINTVIPLLLSKIHSEVHGLRTGKNVSENDELRFDDKTQTFKTAGMLTKDIRSHIAEDMVSYARSRATSMKREVIERLKDYSSPNKERILSNLDKWFISYITEYGAISPEAMGTARFLKFVPNNFQLEAADLFKAFLTNLRTAGYSKGIYDLFQSSGDFLKMSPAMMQKYTTGMNGDLAIRSGLINVNGLTGATTVNGAGIKDIFKHATRSKTYSVNSDLSDDYFDFGLGHDFKGGLKHDWNSLKSGIKGLNSGLQEGSYVGAYGTNMSYNPSISEAEQAAQNYKLKRDEFIRKFDMDPENVQLKKTDPERYNKKLRRALEKFDRDPTIKRILRYVREGAANRMGKFTAPMSGIKNFFNDKYVRGTSYAKSKFDKAYTYGSDLLNSSGIPAGVNLEDIRFFTQHKLDETFSKLNSAYNETKNNKAKIINEAKENIISQVSKILPKEQLEAVKAYVAVTDPKEIYQEAINKTQASMDEGKEYTELALRAIHGDQEAIQEIKDRASGSGQSVKEKLDKLQDDLLAATKELKDKAKGKFGGIYNSMKEEIDAIKKKKPSERTLEEREKLIDARVDRLFEGVSSLGTFLKNPTAGISKLLWMGAKGAIKAPWKFWNSGFAKDSRSLERRLYGRLFKEGIPALGRGAMSGLGALGSGISSLGGLAWSGISGIWDNPITKALRRKERRAYGMADDNLYDDNDPDAPKNKNSWWNRLKTKASDKKDSAKDVKAPEKKEGFFSKLKGLLKPLLFVVPGILGAISTGIGKVVSGIATVGGFITSGFSMLSGLLGKVMGSVVGGAKALGGVALKGATKVATKVAESKVGQTVAKTATEAVSTLSKTSIAKKITDILKSFSEPIMKRLGKKAGAKFFAGVAGKIAARAIPFLGWGLLLYDAAMAIKYMTIDGLDLKSAVSKAVLGFDLFNENDPVIDENGEPVKPDEPEEVIQRAKEKAQDPSVYMVDGKNVSKSEHDKAVEANKAAMANNQTVPHKTYAEYNLPSIKEDSEAKKLYLDFLNAFNKLDPDARSLKLKAEMKSGTVEFGDLEDKRYYNLGEPAGNVLWDCLKSETALVMRYPTDDGFEYWPTTRDDYIKILKNLKSEAALKAVKDVSGESDPSLSNLKITYYNWLDTKIKRIQESIIIKAGEQKSSGVLDMLKKILNAAFGNTKIDVPKTDSNQPSKQPMDQVVNRDNKVTNPANNYNYSGSKNIGSIYDDAKTSKKNEANGMTKENLMNIAMRSMNRLGWSPREQAMFLANVQHETGNYRWFAELGGPSYFAKYDGRKDLGNTSPGDGARFKGRGLIHLTGRANYADIGARMGVDLIKYPELLEDDPKLAVASAIAWWERQKEIFPKFRAAIENDDIKTVNKGVNGGSNGMQERISYYNEFKKKLNADEGGAPSAYANGAMFQQALKGDFASTKGIEGINDPSRVSTSVQGANTGYNTSSGYYNNYATSNIDMSNLPEKSKALVENINKSAGASSQGRCATYVRQALDASGFKTSDGSTVTKKYRDAGMAGSAYMYDSNGILEDAGFKKIDPNTPPLPGDIEVFGQGRNINHGHIQVYNGDYWVSDFHQSGGSKNRPYGTPGMKYSGMVPSLFRYDPNTEALKPENIGDSTTDGSATPTTTASGVGTDFTSPGSLEIQKTASSNMAVDSLATTISEGNNIQVSQLDVNKQMLNALSDIRTILAESNTGDDLATTRIQNQRQQQLAAGKENLQPINTAGVTANNTNLIRTRPEGILGQEKIKTM
nr:MAG TPA: Chitinase A [Caudoviricetes sp.]